MIIDIKDIIRNGSLNTGLGLEDPTTGIGYQAETGIIGISTIGGCWYKTGELDTDWRRLYVSTDFTVTDPDMKTKDYDPQSISGDMFNMANMTESSSSKIMTSGERDKLSTIESGAQDNTIEGQNIQNVVVLPKSDYDNIVSPSSSTLYLISDTYTPS